MEDAPQVTEEVQTGTDQLLAKDLPQGESVPVSRGLYFVRIPRPAYDDSTIKGLKEKLQKHVDVLKRLNANVQNKRGEVNELRKQLGVARSLRDGSNPEFHEKNGRLKELREHKSQFVKQIQAIKEAGRQLDVRSEEELDERIREIEAQIAHGDLQLRQEKQMVQQIGKLKAQRERVREHEGQRASLAQLEAEAAKVSAVIAELSGEYNILKGERDQAHSIITDLQEKLQVVSAALTAADTERADAEARKREVSEALKAAYDALDAAMHEFRENRKLGVTLRDMVIAGQVDEAAAAAAAQVSELMGKLAAEPRYRKDVTRMWCEQRRYLVSELLPKSGAPDDDGGKASAAAAAAGKRGVERAAVPAKPPPELRAQEIIAAALKKADDAIAAARAAPAPEPLKPEPESDSPGPASVADEEEARAAATTKPPVRQWVPGATEEMTAPAPRPRTTHKPQHNYTKILAELPVIDYVYTPPVVEGSGAVHETDAERKARIREENRHKAAEAEQRKVRRQEVQAKKKEKAALAAAAERASARPVGRAAELVADARAVVSEAELVSGTDAEAEVVPLAAADGEARGAGDEAGGGVRERRSGGKGGKGGGKAGGSGGGGVKVGAPRRVPRVAKQKSPVKQVQHWLRSNSVAVAVAGFVVLLLILLLLWLRAPTAPPAVVA